MSEKFLPQGWKVGRLGDKTLARTVSGGTPNRSVPEYYTGNVPWVKSGELNDNYIFDTEEKITNLGMKNSSAKIFPKGTLLIAMYGATAGKTGILALDAATNQAVCAIFPINDSFDSNFLQYYLIHIREEILCSRSGGAQPNISQRVISSLKIILPPLMEQRAIARALRAVQAAREARLHEAILERERKAALMEHLFRHGTRGEATKQTEIGEMPESWKLFSCEQLCEKITVGVVVRPSSYYVPSGVPAFRSFNIREDRIVPNDLVYFSHEANDTILSKSKIKTGDVLIVRTGYPGTASVVPEEFDGANCIDLVIARPNQSLIICEYLSRYLNSSEGKRQALASEIGLAQKHLNVGAVNRMLIPLPSIEEQSKIASILKACDAKIASLDHEARLLDELFRAILEELRPKGGGGAGERESNCRSRNARILHLQKYLSLPISMYLWRSAEIMDKPDPLSVLGKKYNRETARHIPYGGLVNSKGIIVKVVTEEQAKAQTKACKEHLMKLLASMD